MNARPILFSGEMPHLPAVERCINWPCAKPAGHAGPCSTELGGAKFAHATRSNRRDSEEAA